MEAKDFPFYDMPVTILLPAAFLMAGMLFVLAILIIQTGRRLANTGPAPLAKVLLTAVNQITDGFIVFLLLYWLEVNPYLAIGAGFAVMIFSGLFSMKIFFQQDWNTTLRLWSLISITELVLMPLALVAYLNAWMYFSQHIYPSMQIDEVFRTGLSV